MEASDLELVQAANAGDDGAFHALVERHAASLMRVAISLSKRREDAEDLLQETFVGAYRGLKNFEGRSSVRTWLVQILTRQAAKAWHKARHHRRTESIHRADETGGERDDFEAYGQQRGVAQTVGQRLDVMQILDSLPDGHREILVLREIRGLSYDEMAETLNVPRGTIESRLFRARAEFRKRMISTEK